MKNSRLEIQNLTLGLILVVFGVLVFAGVVSAASSTDLQPASTITYNEAVKINSTLTVSKAGYFTEGVHIGSTAAGVGGVTYFNGTIVNASVDSSGGNTIPVTFGDDVRIDGQIYRTEVGGSNNLKLADTIQPQANNTYSLGTSALQMKDGYFAGALTVVTYNTAQTRYWSLNASEMDPMDVTTVVYSVGSGCLTSTTDNFSAPVNLPQGAVVTKLTVNYTDNAATDFAVDLKRSVNGTDEEMASVVTSGASSAYQSGEDSSIIGAAIDNSQYGYRLEIADDAMDDLINHVVCNIEIAYTVTNPLP